GVAVVANGLDRAALEGLHAEGNLLLRGRLFVHERVASLVMAREKSRRGFAAKVAVDALLIDVKFAPDVFRPLVCFVGHGSPDQSVIKPPVKRGNGPRWPRPFYPMVTGICGRRLVFVLHPSMVPHNAFGSLLHARQLSP